MQYDNHPLPTSDEDYEVAAIASLVPGASARMLDPRRTPVRISAVAPETATFTVEVLGFEDAGAVWDFPLWDIAKFQIKCGGKKISLSEEVAISTKVEQFKKRIFLNCDAHSTVQTNNKLISMKIDVEKWLAANSRISKTARDIDFEAGKGCEGFRADLENWLKTRGLTHIDNEFMRVYSSNPNSGEFIKGHRIVLAELGICPYKGYVQRDPKLFDGLWSRQHRAEHIVARLSFIRAAFKRLGFRNLPLYRTTYSDDRITAPRNTGFVSTTFSRDVAMALFEAGHKARQVKISWQHVSIERVFMTFLETPNLCQRYDEAEAILLFDPENGLF